VLVVVDQLPSWALERYAPLLSGTGALRPGLLRGGFFPQSRFGYAATYTAPGHASLATGALPREHGVVANEVWDATRERSVSVVDDHVHTVIGETSAAASPAILRVPTVADALEAETQGVARTVSLSFKDRAAVLLGGQRPDLALWYDTKRGRFTSSSYYGEKLPAWLVRFQEANPVWARFAEWTPERPDELARRLGPDEPTGKGDFLGLGKVFPHDPRRSTDPNSTFRVTPAASEYLFDLARAAVKELDLGGDDVPDLLMLSISGVDYAGHVFGAESWEYVDHLRRTDGALGRLLDELARKAPTSVLITSDHGVAPLPERAAPGTRALRLSTAHVVTALNQKLLPPPGSSKPVIAAYVEPFLYFSGEARHSPGYGALLETAAREVAQLDGFEVAYPVADLLAGQVPPEGTSELARASVTTGAGGDVFVVVREHSVIDPRMPGGSGTSHGSPWRYDQLVPVVFFGPGVAPHSDPGEVDVLRVAATLSALLGIPPPANAKLPKLAGSP
jgi:hypothetical protein